MISLHNRLKSRFCSTIVLLFLGLVCSCVTMTPDPREELLRSLKGANVEGYYFATKDSDTQVIASLTNNAVRNFIKLDSDNTNVVLRYTSVKDKNLNSTRTYKTEITKTGTALTLLVTDITTSEVVTKQTFPAPELHKKADATGRLLTFDSLEDCIRDFDCAQSGAFQCDANRTCQPQLVALTCCLNNGQCFSVHLIIRPNTRRCLLGELIPELEGLVLSK
jgi:hypothetical protein